MATYVNNLRLTELATGEGSGTWGTTTNTNLELIGEALGYGSEAVANASTHTITVADGTADSARSFYLKLTGGGQACTVTLAPNTLSKVWMVENTTNSTLTFSQGSGANVAIAAGAVKMIATDGAGSGAVVYDLLVDTDLTGTTTVVNLTSSGTIDAATVEFNSLSGTGSVAITDILDQDNMSSNSATALATQQSIKAYVDSSVASFDTLAEVLAQGNTTGSTDIEVTTAQKVQFRDSAIYINSSADGQLDIVADTEIQIAATTIDINGAINASGEIIAASLDISGNIDVDGVTNLDVVDIDGAVDMASTLAVAGDANFDSGTLFVDVSVNSVGIGNGTTEPTATLDVRRPDASGKIAEFHQSAGFGLELGSSQAQAYIQAGSSQTLLMTVPSDMTIDAGGDIILDADGGDWRFKDAGAEIFKISNGSGFFAIKSQVIDADINFLGSDGGSEITALTLDMSDGGSARFAHDISLVDSGQILLGAGLDGRISSDGTNLNILANNGDLTLDVAGDINLDADGGDIQLLDGGVSTGRLGLENGDLNIASMRQDYDIRFKGMDGNTTPFTALTLDMSAAGAATFNSTVGIGVAAHATIPVSAYAPDASGNLKLTRAGTSESLTLGTYYITASGNDLNLSTTGDLTLDAAGDIILDAGGAEVKLKDDGLQFGQIYTSSNNLYIQSSISNKDLKFEVNDAGTILTALTLDGASAGAATFNAGATFGGSITTTAAAINGQLNVTGTTNSNNIFAQQLSTQFDTSSFMRFHPSSVTNSGGFTNIFFGTSTSNNYGVAIGGKRAGTNDEPTFAIRMLNDSTTGTEVLNIANSGAATFSSNIVFGDGHFIGDDADDNLWLAGGSNENIIIDSAEDIFLDAANQNINLRVAGSAFGRLVRTSSAYLSVQSNGGNLRLGANNTDYWSIDEYRLYPVTDNVDDIGLANNRVKDLYLSGGVFLGGTGAANKLDDYEEGTWSPQIYYQNSTDQGNASNTTQTGLYTKIGRVVTVNFRLIWNISGSPATDNIGVKNLPFTGTGDTFSSAGTAFPINNTTTINTVLLGKPASGGTLTIFESGDMAGNLGNKFGSGNNKEIRGTLTYFTSQ